VYAAVGEPPPAIFASTESIKTSGLSHDSKVRVPT
jgi:hypothetical protein